MEWNNLSTQIKGDISELNISAALMSQGWNVSKPISQNSRYDFVFEYNNNFYKVQCKHALFKNGCLVFIPRSVKTTTQESKYYTKDIDYFGVYSSQLNKCYLFPIDICSKTSCSFRIEKPLSKQKLGIKWAHKYELKMNNIPLEVIEEESKKEINEIDKLRIQSIRESNIDFTKRGWGKEVAKILGTQQQRVANWMRKYVPDLYKITCY
jgi:hypothetical protein